MPGPRADISPALQAELEAEAIWMYPWQLSDDVVAPCPGTELADVHRTRLEIIEPTCRRWLAENPETTVVDLGCCEGWFGHKMLEWGAKSVVGVDVREVNVRRAELVRDHYGISPERLSFIHAGVHEVPEIGQFDLALVLGLIYHLEDPIGALRVARRLSRGHVLVETQLTDRDAPIEHGWGVAGEFKQTDTHWVAYLEPADWQTEEGNITASFADIISLVPNRAALLQALTVVGFDELEVLPTAAGQNIQYTEGHRAVVAGRAA
jgi:SAM-dependent methyltransferase